MRARRGAGAAAASARMTCRAALASIGLISLTSLILLPLSPAAAQGSLPSSPGGGTAPARLARIAGTIQVGIGPAGVAVDSRTGTVWVANLGDGTVSEIKESTERVIETLVVGGEPEGVAVDSARGLVWVSDYAAAGSIWEISQARHRVIRQIPAGVFPELLAVDQRAGILWVASPDYGEVFTGTRVILAVDENSGKILRRIVVGTAAQQSDLFSFTVDPAAGLLYVCWDSSGTDYYVSTISERSGTFLRTISLPVSDRYYYLAGASRSGVWITKYVSDLNNSFNWLNDSTGTLSGDIKLPSLDSADPSSFFNPVLDQETRQTWLIRGSLAGSSILIIDMRARSVAMTIPAGRYAQSLAIDPVTGKAYVSNYLAHSVTVIQGQAPAAIGAAARLTATAGVLARFVFRAAGWPVPDLTERGPLPPGLSFSGGRGRAVLSGTPARGDGNRQYRFEIVATNGIGPAVVQWVRIGVR
jgi:YVTN family beta-propeller protein